MRGRTFLQFALSFFCLMSCSESEEYIQTMEVTKNIQINGNCEIYSLANEEEVSWNLISDSEWIVPVKNSGNSSDKIEIYVESNSSKNREGEVTIQYANGITRSTRVEQSTSQDGPHLQKSYAVGWGLDITTYMDSRGLKDQILNAQKVINNLGEDYIQYDNSTKQNIIVHYGESYDALCDNISASLSANVKVSAFELGLKGQFGNNAIKDAKRFFSWMRGTYVNTRVNITNIDLGSAYDEDLLTRDFAEQYKEVVNSNGSDESISNLINRYGTHIVTISQLGGFLDYYYSSSIENVDETMDISGAISFGYKQMFKVEGSGDYNETYNNLKSEMIEKFTIKGGNAIDLTNKVISKTLNGKDMKDWLKSLGIEDGAGTTNEATDIKELKLELVDFQVMPISVLFPYKISKAIDNYIVRVLYYGNVNVTRSLTDN